MSRISYTEPTRSHPFDAVECDHPGCSARLPIGDPHQEAAGWSISGIQRSGCPPDTYQWDWCPEHHEFGRAYTKKVEKTLFGSTPRGDRSTC